MPQYRYAFDKQRQLVDAFDLERQDNQTLGPYYCIGCSNEMIAKVRGEKMVKHFAHKALVPCQEETYLHLLGKTVFVNTYKQCLDEDTPFEIELTYQKICKRKLDLNKIVCDLGTVTKKHDLTRRYQGIKVEKKDGQFIPDVLLYNTNKTDDKIYIEIAVTHYASAEKKYSGQRIIELDIDHELQLQFIEQCLITESHGRFYGFRKTKAKATDAECRCANKIYWCFIIYKNGKANMKQMDADDISDFLTEPYVDYFKVYPEDRRGLTPRERFIHYLQEARKEGFPVKNCYLCRMSGNNFKHQPGKPVFCKKKKISCSSNDGAKCSSFWLKE